MKNSSVNLKVLIVIIIGLLFSSCEKEPLYEEESTNRLAAVEVPSEGLISEYLFDNYNLKRDGVFPLSPDIEPYLNEGKIGYGLSFNGEVQFFSTSTEFQEYFDLNNVYSICLWFKSSEGGCLFACDGENNYPYKRTKLSLRHDGRLIFSRYNANTMGGARTWGAYPFVSRKDGFDNDEWHFLVAIYDAKTLTICVDNEYWETFSGLANGTKIIGSEQSMESGKTTQVTIGGCAQNNLPRFIGTMDQIRVYNKVLTDNEIELLYNEN